MFSGTHSVKRATDIDLVTGTGFQGTWQRSEEVGAGEGRNRRLVKQRIGRFQARDC